MAIKDLGKSGLPLNNVTELLADSKFDFHLTGSRYMEAGISPNSDWDFMAEYNEAIVKFLVANGFVDVLKYGDSNYGNPYTSDDFTIGVYQITHEGIKYQVQLVNKLDRKLKVRDTIKHMSLRDFHASTDGINRTALWNLIGAVLFPEDDETLDLPF